IVAALLGLDVPSVVASNSLLSETLFTSLVTAAILLQLEAVLRCGVDLKIAMKILIAALLIGLAILVRPIGEVLIVITPLPVIFLRRVATAKRIALGLLAVSIPLMVVAGWSYRNWEQRGAWTISTIASINTYYYRAAGVLAYEDGRSFEQVQSDLQQSSGDSVERLSPAMAEELGRRGRAILRRDPGAFAIITLRGFLRAAFWVDRSGIRALFGFAVPRDESKSITSAKISAVLSNPFLTLLLLVEFGIIAFTWTGVGLALWQLIISQNRNSALIIIPLFAALLLLAASAGPESYDRFRVPAMPMLALIAASGWGERFRENRGEPAIDILHKKIA
ncbi:MAG TPA: hypothetical protein VFX22_08755, partial [Candidatus Kapabacteria bacterium]|nr:hypothetical protein [Candidatus Kapabacteria bacterium]